ncbi:MAG: EAL domain-containing protein [Pseudomonadota bacterium]
MVELKEQDAETIVYENFVEQLFAGRGQLLAGVCLQVGVMLCICADTLNPLFAIFAVCATMVGCWRILQIDGFHREKAAVEAIGKSPSKDWYRSWEMRSTGSTTVGAALIGFCSGAGVALGDNEFSALVSILFAFAAIPSVVVRLYGSMSVACSSLIMLLAPLVLSFVWQGSTSHYILAALAIPFLFSAVSLTKSVRSTFVFAVMGNLEKRQLDRRLRDAVGSMSHGLVMVDDDHRIIVVNDQAKRIFHVPESLALVNRKLDTAMRYLRLHGPYGRVAVGRIDGALRQLIYEQVPKAKCALQGGQVLEMSGADRVDGGHVILIEDISDQEAARKRFEQMRTTDSVTRLPNRELFHSLVAKALDSAPAEMQSAVIVFDIDDFKRINDNAGHIQGDRMLKAVGLAARRHLGKSAIVSRQGADEFLAFVQAKDLCAKTVAAGLTKTLSRPFNVRGEQFAITVSAGAAFVEPSDDDGSETMIKAGVALVEAKEDGIGATCLYNSAMETKQLRRQFLKSALVNAINNGEIRPLYQPIVCGKTGRLAACEALSRWESDAFGVVSANEFIPLAEEMGHITPLTRHILQQALKDCETWPKNISVSVNLSARDFHDGSLVDWLLKHIDEVEFDADRLEVEITETSFMHNEAFVARKLLQLRARGVRVALDDFGTGYSSFNHLHQLPLDRVKIDRSFLVDSSNGEAPVALLEGILAICQRLGLKTTVEGVETEGQVSMLRSLGGVQRMQGYFFGSALPGSAIKTLAEAQGARDKSSKAA